MLKPLLLMASAMSPAVASLLALPAAGVLTLPLATVSGVVSAATL
jgi:hypothetical protein